MQIENSCSSAERDFAEAQWLSHGALVKQSEDNFVELEDFLSPLGTNLFFLIFIFDLSQKSHYSLISMLLFHPTGA